jgi:hypothetical protein
MKNEKNVLESKGNLDQSNRSVARQEVIDEVKNYLQILDDTWDVAAEVKDREYKRLKMLIKYQLILNCPLPALVSTIAYNSEQIGTGNKVDGQLYLPQALKDKVKLAAKQLNCSPNEAVATILSQGVGKYTSESKKLLSDKEDDQEEDDDFDI